MAEKMNTAAAAAAAATEFTPILPWQVKVVGLSGDVFASAVHTTQSDPSACKTQTQHDRPFSVLPAVMAVWAAKTPIKTLPCLTTQPHGASWRRPAAGSCRR